MKIQVINAVYSLFPTKFLDDVQECLEFEAVYYRKGQWSQVRETYQKKIYSVNHETGLVQFPTGLISRIQKHCEQRNIKVEVEGYDWINYDLSLPALTHAENGEIEFRSDQRRLIHTINPKSYYRGTIISPTGTGKTIILFGILSRFPKDSHILMLAHTKSLVSQLYDDAVAFGFDPQIISGETKKILKKKVVISTIQSFIKIPKRDYQDYFDIVAVDEGHHVSKFEGQYATVLSNLLAPVRLAFTATESDKEEGRLALEGLIGPVVGRFTMAEATKKEILAKPNLILHQLPFNYTIKSMVTYPDVYDYGIINNKDRNNLIFDVVSKFTARKKTCLVIVKDIYHGEILETMGNNRSIKTHFVQGCTKNNDREEIKKDLQSKDIDCVICTTVWKEGINIPSLDCVINGAGGKSEIATLQAIGRGTRRTKEKDEMYIIDFFDPSHKFLIEHFGQRLSLYFNMGWIGTTLENMFTS